ncbi:MAG: hypothetical protein V3V21_05305 [Thermoplasmata archaeon]
MSSEEMHEWCRDNVHGTGGLHSLEYHESVSWGDRDVGIVEWVIRCLANPRCTGSGDMLDEIEKRRRAKLEANE